MHSTINMQSMVKLGESGDMLPRKIGSSEMAFWAKLLCNAIVCLEPSQLIFCLNLLVYTLLHISYVLHVFTIVQSPCYCMSMILCVSHKNEFSR